MLTQEEVRKLIQTVLYEQEILDDTLHFRLVSLLPAEVTLVYYLVWGKEVVARVPQTKEHQVSFRLKGSGLYRIKIYLKTREFSASRFCETIPYEATRENEEGEIERGSGGKEKKIHFTSICENYMEYSNGHIRGDFSHREQEILFGISDGAYFMSRDYYKDLLEFTEGKIDGKNIAPPFDWDFSRFRDRRIPYRMHAFLRQSRLLSEFWRTLDTRYRDLFLSYVLDWIQNHPEVDFEKDLAWHDDATARRVYFFCITLLLFEKLLTREEIDSLRRSLRMQVRLLCRESFYKFNHNHGMYQDRALAMYGLTFSEEPDYHLTMAMERSRAYFRYAFTTDGVHKEHSPMYHLDIGNSIAWFALAYRDYCPAYSRELEQLKQRMADYAVWVTMPDSQLPSIGDSGKRRRSLPIWKTEKEYLWVSSGGKLGDPPATTARIFREAGYGIIRKDWRMDGSGTWMMLLAATHSMAHKHNDDLSFLLYHKGELITEAGNRNYNYEDPLTEYVYTSYAHNVLFVNGQGWGMKPNHLPLLEPAAFQTGITNAIPDGPVQSVSGRQIRFPGVVQERTLCYEREKDIVTVLDEIRLEKPASLRLIYHTAPGIGIRETEDGWFLSRENSPAAQVRVSGSSALSKGTYRGEGEGVWRTWIFHGKPDAVCGGVLAVDVDGRRGVNTICLQINLL